jgi:hypothetical protein
MVALASLTGLLPACASVPQSDPDTSLLDFAEGRYVFVGRYPDSDTTYTGTALISERDGTTRIVRTIGSKSMAASVTLEVPRPPGEGQVVRIRWRDEEPHVMTCLPMGDLDNYLRLTCIWRIEGREFRTPGLETYYSIETWPDPAPADARE